ncbi:TonB-dependent receptor plug domain protein, partial [Ostertagia ostertagi]
SENAVLIISYTGYELQEVPVKEVRTFLIRMVPFARAMDSVIVVGYGRQKKESVVGAITQTTGAVLQRAGGVSNIGAALTGNVPGVITVQGTGLPGAEDPAIFIRGQGTWNGSQPLILVDGIERALSGVDIASVENISILKDASATAVFGVKGANGVVLITTKRGSEGKAAINVIANVTSKIPSRLPQKYDAYDALRIRNLAIERELEINGAYNGSDQFGPDFRFDFFPSAAIGWTITNEKFMDRQTVIGNPDLRWETVAKTNIGLDYSILR